ncbi:MAG: DUF393 domain-containing protein [Elusimicrobia bacterium]|nr:DUF393 domain-containing protein [Elusimicrobiota bacterium]
MKNWDRWFLAERPSLCLGWFRVALAAAVGLHVIPSLLQMPDNYLAGTFREYNPSFFPVSVLAWVDRSPDGLVWAMAAVFLAAWLAFLLGLFTQPSGIAMGLACYYFYARNSLHIGTLSWDIMLVTLFLMLATPYPGDCFSLDSLIRGDPEPWQRRRSFFVQSLLRMQLAATYFFTGLAKVAGEGNWLTDNPYYYLMNATTMGVIKDFPGREFLAGQPGLCYAIGLGVVFCELNLWWWLWWRRTRPYAIALGFLFHFLLLATMHVPTNFFFLFPPQLLLFVEPEAVLGWIEARRRAWTIRGRDRLVFDGACGFCRAALARIQALDLFGRLLPVDFRSEDVSALHAGLTPEACHARLQLLEPGGRLCGGFSALRRLSLRLPLLWPLAPWLHLPGLRRLGDPVYDWVARHRFNLLHRFRSCSDNACAARQ